MKLTIISLCDFSGVWSQPYVDAGYDVLRFDIKHGHDVRQLARLERQVQGILAAPPCTSFARSGSRWWVAKGPQALVDGLAVVDACLRIVYAHKPRWWALENPIGRLKDYLGEPAAKFDPCDYGDPWTKRTWLWGDFRAPAPAPIAPVRGCWTNAVPGGKNQATRRSVTPPGFARAFFEANP